MRIVIAGGGTGGHLYPGIALAETFQRLRSEAKILFIGTTHGIGARPTQQEGFVFETVAASGFVGLGIGGRIKSLFAIPLGLIASIKALKRFSPQLVIGMGGYVTGPVLLAAILLRIKRVILEPNVVPGMANRFIAPYAHLIFTAFEESRPRLRSDKIRRLGVPVRPEIISAKRVSKDGHATPTLLILGGSQGAHAINQSMIEALPFLAAGRLTLSIIHQTGKSDRDWVQAAYRHADLQAEAHAFIDDMAGAYSKADLIVSRAGAGTLSELAVLGKPSLLIPFPYAAAHQEENAAAFVSAGASVMIRDRELSGAGLAKTILSLLSDSKKLAKMGVAAKGQGRPKAAEEIVRACLELVER